MQAEVYQLNAGWTMPSINTGGLAICAPYGTGHPSINVLIF